MNIIEITNLYKKYKNAADFSVQNVSLQIAQGEIYGILGPNGAGKTTLISMLCGLIKPTAGHYTLCGMSAKDRLNDMKKMTGIVPQEYALYPTLTARENLMFFGSLYGLKHETLKHTINEMLDRVGLSAFADKQIEHFSGGMKRRCNLVAGIMHQPRILFLDEPTVGVDVQSRSMIIEYLQELNQQGMSIVYTSHHLQEAEEFCTKIAIIDHGKIYAEGSPAALIASTPEARNLEDVFITLTGKDLRDAI